MTSKDLKKLYTRLVVCSNCKYMGDLTLPKRKLISDTPCIECNCKTLTGFGEYEQKMAKFLHI